MALLAVLFAGPAGPLFAADLPEPQVEEAPPPVVEQQPVDVGGWYIRGDLDYHWSRFGGADYITYGAAPQTQGSFASGSLKGALSAGAGIGYQVNQYFRTDLTADWMSRSNFRGSTVGFCAGGVPCVSTDTSSYSALLLLANAYIDIGTWHGVTPYVGAGIGGAWVKWDTLHNSDLDGDFFHQGGKGWRFAYALMAGASYCLTDRVKLDVGYRYSHINGGKMFEYASDSNVGPGYDHGINVHEVRGGLRYQFGGQSDCAPPPAAYVPPEPIYTK
jgi:opacity protein-like surface antigen